MIEAFYLVQIMAQSDVVQVELINKSPWRADSLPWIAIVVSVLTLGWTIYDRKRGAARIVARDFSFIPSGKLEGLAMPLVSCRIENKGLVQATEISSIRCSVPEYRLREYGACMTIRMELTRDLPFRIESGASVAVALNEKQILWALEPGVKLGQRWRRSLQLRRAVIEVTTGHGVTKLRLSRWVRADLSKCGSGSTTQTYPESSVEEPWKSQRPSTPYMRTKVRLRA